MTSKKHNFLILQCLVLIPFCIFGQKNNNLNEFSDYNALENQILKLQKQPDSALFYVNFYIKKAKKENSLQQLISGYDYAVKNSPRERQIKYGDSMILTAVKLKSDDEIGEAFISLGQTYMGNELYKDALNHTLSGYDYFKINNNPYLINTAKRNIAKIKTYLEDYHDAKKINQECLDFFRNHREKIKDTDYTLYYIYSLIALINNNTHLQEFQDNPKLLQEGISFVSNNPKYKDYLPYLISSQGLDAYFRKDYQSAVRYFNQSLSLYTDKWEHLTDTFYLGMSYTHLWKHDNALPYLLTIDEEYDKTGKLDPEFRPAYEALIDYYKLVDNRKQELFYINKLMKLDKEINENKSYISSKVKVEYDEASLLQFKNNIEKIQLFERLGYGGGTLAIIIALAFVLFKIRKSKQIFDYELEENISENQEIRVKSSNPISIETTEYDIYKPIGKETVIVLLKKLEDFENQKGFTKLGLKLYDLAIDLGTNERYLSKIISVAKGKNFNQYVNELRMDHFVLLRENKTDEENIKSLAKQSGFDDYSIFYRTYKERFQVNPSIE